MKNLKYSFTKISIIIGLILFVSTVGFYQIAAAQDSAQEEANKTVLKRLIDEVYNQKNFNVIHEIADSNYVEHTNGVTTNSAEAIKETVTYLNNQDPDFAIIIEDMIAKGDNVTIRWIYSGKNKKFNKKVIIHGIFIGQFANGKMVEGWQIFDNWSRYKQLGYTLISPTATIEE